MGKTIQIYWNERREAYNMTLSANLIADSLQQFGGTMMLAQEREFFFSKVQMLSLSHADELRDDVLYISDARTLRKMSKKNFKNHFFVFSAKVSCLEQYSQFLNAITFSDEYSINDIINHLVELFQLMNDYEYRLQLAAHNHNNYDVLMALAREMFPNCLILVADSAYNIIASSHQAAPQNSYLDKLLSQGYYDKDSLQMMAKQGYFTDPGKYLKPAISIPPNVCGNTVILKSYYTNNVFYSFVGCYFLEGEPTAIDLRLFECLTEQIDTFFQLNEFYDRSMPKRQKMLDDLIHAADDVSSEYIHDRCRELWIPQYGDFRLGYISFDDDAYTRATHLAIQLRVWCNVKNYGVFQYNSSIVILFHDWHNYSVSELLTFQDNWREMIDIIKNNQGHIGISLLFQDIAKLKVAYRQAKNALDIGSKFAPEKLVLHYGKYAIYDMLWQYGKTMPLTSACVPYLNNLTDKTGNNNLAILYHYIRSERNISSTANIVHMHRNSVIYRLQKIQDALKLNLDDPDVRLWLMVSFKILEMAGKLEFITSESDKDHLGYMLPAPTMD